MIKAVIFDMDGLLIDSEPLWREAEIEVFKLVNVILNDELCQRTTGLRIDQVVDYWYQRFPWQNMTREEVAARVVNRVIELIRLTGKPLPGVKEAISFFAQKEVKLALASSSAYSLIEVTLGKLSIRDRFQEIYSATEEEYGKPHPSVYITTAKKLQVLPEECLVIEDSLNGVLAAKAARMKCIAIPEDFTNYNQKLIIADVILESLLAIEDIWYKLARES